MFFVAVARVLYEFDVGAENRLLDAQVATRIFWNFGYDNADH